MSWTALSRIWTQNLPLTWSVGWEQVQAYNYRQSSLTCTCTFTKGYGRYNYCTNASQVHLVAFAFGRRTQEIGSCCPFLYSYCNHMWIPWHTCFHFTARYNTRTQFIFKLIEILCIHTNTSPTYFSAHSSIRIFLLIPLHVYICSHTSLSLTLLASCTSFHSPLPSAYILWSSLPLATPPGSPLHGGFIACGDLWTLTQVQRSSCETIPLRREKPGGQATLPSLLSYQISSSSRHPHFPSLISLPPLSVSSHPLPSTSHLFPTHSPPLISL